MKLKDSEKFWNSIYSENNEGGVIWEADDLFLETDKEI